MSPIVAGIDVVAKAREQVLTTARVVAPRKEAATGFAESGGALTNSRAEISATHSPAKPEQPSQPSGFGKNIASQIQGITLKTGQTRIELAPRGLGSIVIDLQPKESGVLQVILRAENPAVLQALRTDREVLLAVLSNGDVEPENISLDFEGFGQGGFQHAEEEGELLHANTDMDGIKVQDDPVLTLNRPVGLGQLDFFT
ncbi:MAG: flagellar hook-length control protein FliK [Rhodobacteraceae bacterium]|nr:flagellar hook-length control protein FliK [Paracoccaceae bacterium]